MQHVAQCTTLAPGPARGRCWAYRRPLCICFLIRAGLNPGGSVCAKARAWSRLPLSMQQFAVLYMQEYCRKVTATSDAAH